MVNANLMTPQQANPTHDNDSRYITAKEIAERLDSNVKAVSVAIARGTFPFEAVKRSGQRHFYDRKTVQNWLDQGAPTMHGHLRIPPKGK